MAATAMLQHWRMLPTGQSCGWAWGVGAEIASTAKAERARVRRADAVASMRMMTATVAGEGGWEKREVVVL